MARDPAWADLIRRIGRPRVEIERGRSPYEALIRAIAHQQLHGSAAAAILGRFARCIPKISFPLPPRCWQHAEAALRACGFSGTKIACIREIAAGALDGTIPTRREAPRLPDVELIERLTTIRGVGRWTVEMLLIFTLGRPDILPVDDFGVREGYRVLSLAWTRSRNRRSWPRSARPGRRSVAGRLVSLARLG